MAAGCGGDGDEGADEPTTTTAAVDGSTTTAADGEEGEGEGEEETCGATLEVTGSEASDGPLDGTSISQGGPAPDALDSELGNMSFAFSSGVIEPDPQFGLTVPVGIPELDPDEVMLLVSISNEGGAEIAEGDRFTSSTATDRLPDDGSIGNIALFSGAEDRLTIQDVALTITAIEDERFCGTVEALGDSAIQELVVVEGSFTAERSELADDE